MQRVAELYASGLTLREVSAHLGIGYRVAYRLLGESGVPARRAGRRREVEKDAAEAAVRSVRWRSVLLEALDQSHAVVVLHVITQYLGRYPTRTEQSAARRAATKLAASGICSRHQLPYDGPGGRVLVLARPGVEITSVDPRLILSGYLGRDSEQISEPERLIRQISVDSARLHTAGSVGDAAAVDRVRRLTARAIADLKSFTDQGLW